MTRGGRRFLLAVAAAAVAATAGASASAYTVKTGFTHGCHEEMTLAAGAALLDGGKLEPWRIPIPAGDDWRAVLDYLADGMDMVLTSDAERFLALSLMAGVRYPDNRGQSVTNANSLREIHTDPDGQDSHFLRSADDDFAAGDRSAMEAGLDYIEDALDTAWSCLDGDRDDEIILVKIYIEYYGLVDVAVWGPAYFLGMAAHTVQDSFSHTVRNDDLHVIRHVMNYIDGISFDYDLERDGLRHSWAMDQCEDDAAEVAAGAAEATADFLPLLVRSEAERAAAWQAFQDTWMGYEAGCDDVNDYCDSRWADLARTDPSMPIWDELFGCGCNQAPGRVHGALSSWLTTVIAALIPSSPVQ